MKRESGFTLIELLLVLAIIGIISAIAIPALLGQRERAKGKAVQENTVSIAGECARIADQSRESGTSLAPGTVATSAVAISAYLLAKNPYTGAAGTAYVAGAATTTAGDAGKVFVTGGTVTDSITGGTVNAVTITGVYLNGGSATTIQKVVALD